jgi:signal transduction histidine kinase
VTYPDQLPEIEGDPELLTQLCANLVENSIRHCPRGATITIGATASDGRVVATFSDDGPGIPTDQREKVLQRFYRMEKSRTTHSSGLGLSLVKAVADLHNASLTLGSRNPGLIVEIAFPPVAARR